MIISTLYDIVQCVSNFCTVRSKSVASRFDIFQPQKDFSTRNSGLTGTAPQPELPNAGFLPKIIISSTGRTGIIRHLIRPNDLMRIFLAIKTELLIRVMLQRG